MKSGETVNDAPLVTGMSGSFTLTLLDAVNLDVEVVAAVRD